MNRNAMDKLTDMQIVERLSPHPHGEERIEK